MKFAARSCLKKRRGLQVCATGLKTDCLRGLTTFTLTAASNIGCRTILTSAFPDVDIATLLAALDDIALSSGSACNSGMPEPSYVLQALGVSTELASTPLRFGLGRFNTDEEIDYCLTRVIDTVKRLRSMGGTAAA